MSVSTRNCDADLIILGGGCAGLSLAARLAASSTSLRVMVLESRRHYEEDRTWCGWRTELHPYVDCVAASWHRWRIVTSQSDFERSSSLYPYEMIPAHRFYDRSCALIQANAAVSLCMGVQVSKVSEAPDSVVVELSDRRAFTAKWVIDTRPSVSNLRAPWLWQNFVGYVVQGDRELTAKLGATPILMDFKPSGTSAVQFMYVLPLGRHSYLCEWTRFSNVHGQSSEIEAQLQNWIADHTNAGVTLGRRESGSLPMAPATQQPRTGSHVFAAGTLGGSMRASTGYAFHSIQRWADRCSASLVAGGAPVPPARNRILNFMDQVFLRLLQDRSSSTEVILGGLFRRTDPDSLVRFLAGVPRSTDICRVMQSLPWLRSSGAALRSIGLSGAE